MGPVSAQFRAATPFGQLTSTFPSISTSTRTWRERLLIRNPIGEWRKNINICDTYMCMTISPSPPLFWRVFNAHLDLYLDAVLCGLPKVLFLVFKAIKSPIPCNRKLSANRYGASRFLRRTAARAEAGDSRRVGLTINLQIHARPP